MKYLRVFLICSLFFLNILVINAQEPVPAPDMSAIGAEAQGPSAEEVANFEKEFGGPPSDFPEPKIERPKAEKPGKIPDEVRKMVDEKDLVKIYCLMTKWKSGEFFGAMNGLKKHIAPGVEKARALGIEINFPDIDSIRSGGENKIGQICSAKSLDEAETLVGEFIQWGTEDTFNSFGDFRSTFQQEMKKRGDVIREKVKTQLADVIEKEKSDAEKEIRAEVDKVVSAKKDSLKNLKAPPDIDALKAEIKASVEAKVEAKKAEIKNRIQAKVDELIGPEKRALEEIGGLFNDADKKIKNEIEASKGQYEQYKKEAFQLRKDVALRLLDKGVEDGMKKLDESAREIDESRKSDSSIKSAGEIKAEIQADRRALEAELNMAVESGDDLAFQDALNNFKMKWEEARRDGEKAMEQSLDKACTVALAQFQTGRNEIANNLPKITGLTSKCSGSVTNECLKINEFAPRLQSLQGKLSDLQLEMNTAEKMCGDKENADKQNLIALLKKIQADGEDVRTFGQALEAEKSKVVIESVAGLCNLAMPEVEAARVELTRNDLSSLKVALDRCAGKMTMECGEVNALFGRYSAFKSAVVKFESDVVKVENMCNSSPTDKDFEKIVASFEALKSVGDNLKSQGKDLQALQSENGSGKALCRAVAQQFAIAKSDLAKGLGELNSIQSSCSGKKDPRCVKVASLASKFTEIQNASAEIMKEIASVGSQCANVANEKPQTDLLDALEKIKAEKEKLFAKIADLKKEAEMAQGGEGIRIEAEEEVSTNLLPRTEQWHSYKEINPSWRPPYFGAGDWYLSRGGESLTYKFSVPKNGLYYVWIRDIVDSFQPRGVRRIVMVFDGKTYGAFSEVNIPVTSSKGNFGWHKNGEGINLSAGNHIMVITKERTTSGAATLDAFYLTTNPSEVPPEK